MQASADESIGKVVFYSYDAEGQEQERTEVEADFAHHVGGILEYLEDKYISHEIVRERNYTIDCENGVLLKIENKLIPASTGYIMIRKNGDYVIRNGMGTDVDMLMDVYEYFGVRY